MQISWGTVATFRAYSFLCSISQGHSCHGGSQTVDKKQVFYFLMAPPSYRTTNIMSKVDLGLIWCLKQVKGFILKFPISESFCWGIQNYMRYIKYWFFFTSGGSVDDVLVRFLLIAQIIKDANLICILFSVKHSQTFWESWMSLSNVYTYPFNQQLVMKTYVESHDKKPKICLDKILTFLYQ